MKEIAIITNVGLPGPKGDTGEIGPEGSPGVQGPPGLGKRITHIGQIGETYSSFATIVISADGGLTIDLYPTPWQTNDYGYDNGSLPIATDGEKALLLWGASNSGGYSFDAIVIQADGKMIPVRTPFADTYGYYVSGAFHINGKWIIIGSGGIDTGAHTAGSGGGSGGGTGIIALADDPTGPWTIPVTPYDGDSNWFSCLWSAHNPDTGRTVFIVNSDGDFWAAMWTDDFLTWNDAGQLGDDVVNFPVTYGTYNGSFAYGNGVFCFVDYSGHIVTSTDNGVTWLDQGTISGSGSFNSGMIFIGDKFVMCDDNGIWTSLDGVVWMFNNPPVLGGDVIDEPWMGAFYGAYSLAWDGKYVWIGVYEAYMDNDEYLAWVMFDPVTKRYFPGPIPKVYDPYYDYYYYVNGLAFLG